VNSRGTLPSLSSLNGLNVGVSGVRAYAVSGLSGFFLVADTNGTGTITPGVDFLVHLRGYNSTIQVL
jgi:hypothetical protein